MFAGQDTNCRLCPRKCGVDRKSGALGYCQAGQEIELFRYGPHHGEEPPITGSNGSGTIFFSRCTMSCVYCQNYPWSKEGKGQICSTSELAAIFKALHDQGCHNWNLVSPTPWLPLIEKALITTRSQGCSLPVVYNTSGFERLQTIKALDGIANIYLTDLRYSLDKTATGASCANDYVKYARKSFRQMWHQVGPLDCDNHGVARRGVICRILILPNHHTQAIDNLHWLADNFGTDVSVSLMSQYTPAYRASSLPAWNRSLTKVEYHEVLNVFNDIGFSTGWVQDFGGHTDDNLIGYQMETQSAPKL